jgi:hypothetical protein
MDPHPIPLSQLRERGFWFWNCRFLMAMLFGIAREAKEIYIIGYSPFLTGSSIW